MILVDRRVGRKNGQTSAERLDTIVKGLRKRVSCKVQAARPDLAGGDFAFDGKGPEGVITIGVELKEISDFCSSMRSDRLAGDQLREMADMYGMIFIIVQGYWKPSDKDILLTIRGREWKPLDLAPRNSKRSMCFHYSEAFRHMLSLSILKNVVVLRSSNEDETLWQIAHLYTWWQREWADHKSADPIKTQTENLFVRNSELRTFAHNLPGVGWGRSKAVEKSFRSVFHAVNASVEQWEEVPGIGPKMASAIWKWIRTEA